MPCNSRVLPLLAALLCSTAGAVELGPVKVNSYLNQPFRALVKLDDVDDLALADIRFGLADHKTYQRFGLQQPDSLHAAKFIVQASGQGGYELLIKGGPRVDEPIVNLLIDVAYTDGRFVKVYTLLMDPQRDKPPAPVPRPESPVTAVARPATAPVASKAPDQPVATLLVGNRSISIIAENSVWHPRYSVYQIMRAFYLVNPEAFERGNIDRLLSGSRLRVPAESLIAEVPRQQAVNFVYRVSRDNPKAVAKAATPLEKTPAAAPVVPSVDKPLPPASAAAKVPAPKATAQPASVQADVHAWRSMAEEFNALHTMLERQNKAMRSQGEALEMLTDSLEQQRSQIQALDQRIGMLESAGVTTITQVEGDSPWTQLLQQQRQLIQRQQQQLELLTRRLQERETRPQAMPSPTPLEPDAPAVPVADSAAALPPERDESSMIVTAPVPAGQPETILRRAADWVLVIPALIAVMLIALLRERYWRRRVQPRPGIEERKAQPAASDDSVVVEPAPKAEAPSAPAPARVNVDNRKPQVKLVVPKQRSQRQQATSEVQVRLEVDVLLAYEQFDEVLATLQQAEADYGHANWIDYKMLELYAATGQCGEFLALLNDRRHALQEDDSIAWENIESMRDRLCKDLDRTSAG